MKIRVEKPKRPAFLVPAVIIFLVIAAVFFAVHSFTETSVPLAYEITGFEGQVQIFDLSNHEWRDPRRGEEFKAGQKIRTGVDGILNLQVENSVRLRVKENSMLVNRECKLQKEVEIYRLGLDEGVIFGAMAKNLDRKIADNKAEFVVSTPQFDAKPFGALFRIQASEKADENRVGVLRGVVEVSRPGSLSGKGPMFNVRALEEAEVMEGRVQSPAKISAETWQELKEGYELLAKSAVMEAEQIDLAQKAGNFFEKAVFDHGTFFTPKVGYAGREFFKDPDSGEVYLETEYDVFPAGSFVGVYIKTRDFDISKYEGLIFDARRKGDEGFPDSFFIELKSKGSVLRKYSARGFLREWTPVDFKFNAQKPTLINEVVFVFTNERVGESKKGVLEFRNFTLTPKKDPVPVAPAIPVNVTDIVSPPEIQSTPVSEPSAAPSNQTSGQETFDEMVPQTISLG
ncbi:MAG: FecR protein [Candidatus Omnitrophica bacterium ADurb.Bin277]|nr:MAG: FecR protein [Candidatus Omnitrophica bacterium ADurb.Bin277]